MGYLKGDWVRFYAAGIQLELEMEVDVSMTMDTIETTDKDSAGWKTFDDGDKSFTASGSANVDLANTTANARTYFTTLTTGDAVALDVGAANEPYFFSGNGLFTEWTLTGPRNGLSTFSFTAQGSGSLSSGTTT